MKMKLFIVLFLSFFALQTVTAQDNLTIDEFTIGKSQPYQTLDAVKTVYEQNYEKFILRDKEVLKIIVRGQNIYFQKFDAEGMKLIIDQSPIEMPKEFYFFNAIELGSKIYFFYYIYEKSQTKTKVRVREIDFETASFSTEESVAFEISEEVDGYKVPVKSLIRPLLYISANEAKTDCMVYFYMKNGEMQKGTKFGIKIFGENLGLKWGNTIDLPYSRTSLVIHSMLLDNKGEFHMILSEYEPSEKDPYWERGMTVEKLKWLRLNGSMTSFNEQELEIDDYPIGASLFQKEERLFVGGYIATEKDRGASGVYLKEITDDKINDLFQIEIPDDLRKKFVNKSEKSMWSEKTIRFMHYGEMTGLEMKDIQLYEDGSILVTGDKNVAWNSGAEGGTTGFYNKETLVTIIKGGKVSSCVKIPVNQASYYWQAVGNTYLKKGMSYFVFFMDNTSNNALSLDDVHEKYDIDKDKGTFTAVRIDVASGSAEKVSLFATEEFIGKSFHKFNISNIAKIPTGFLVEGDMQKKNSYLIKVEVSE